MEEFWILILVLLFATNSPDKAESVQLEELPLQTFDELFVDEWLDKDEAEDLNRPPTNFGQNVQIDRQNTQIGQIEPNSIDQNPPLTKSDQSGQIEPNSNDQNPPLTESGHSRQIEPNSTDERKRKIVDKFHSIKDKFKQKGKHSKKEWNQIEKQIAKHLQLNRKKIYEWKKEFGLSRRNPKNEQKNLVEKFDQMKAELKRDGFKNSQHELDKTVAKELGLGFKTISNWKRKLGQTTPKHKRSHSEQKELMKQYYEIKDQNPKIRNEDIAKMLKIDRTTLFRWKKQFKRQQLHPNSVDGHSVEENATENAQEIQNSNSGSF